MARSAHPARARTERPDAPGRAGSGAPEEPSSPSAAVTLLVNRVAALTFLTAIAFVAGLAALPHAADPGKGALARALAALPLLVAVGAAVGSWRGRVSLRRARAQDAGTSDLVQETPP